MGEHHRSAGSPGPGKVGDVDDVLASLAPLDRRRFLLTSLGAAAGLAVAGGAGCSSDGPPPPTGIAHLTPFEYRLFDRLANVLLPVRQEDGLPPLSEIPVVANIDAMFGDIPPGPRSDLGKGLKLFHYGSIVVGWHFATFLSLDDGAATAYCRAWESGREIQRALMAALKQIVYISYWRDERTWQPIGYAGPVTAPNGIGRLGNAPLPEAG